MKLPAHNVLPKEDQEELTYAAAKAKALPVDSLIRKKLIDKAIAKVKERNARRFKTHGGGI